MALTRWTRCATALAALAAGSASVALAALAAGSASVAQKEPVVWTVSCARDTLTVTGSDTSLTGTCGLSGSSPIETASYDAQTGVNLMLNNVMSDLTVIFTNIGSLHSLIVTDVNGNATPKVAFTDEFTSNELYALSFNGVNFVDTNLTLPGMPELNFLSVVGTNAKDIGTSPDTKLGNLMLGGSFSVIPRILYQANYGDAFNFTQDDTFSISLEGPQNLTTEQYHNLGANFPERTDFGIECNSIVGDEYTCTSVSSGSKTKHSDNSNLPSSTTASSSSDSNHHVGSSSSTGSTGAEAGDGGGDGLSTVLIVVIVIVVLVALVLLFFIVRHCRSLRSANAANCADDNTVTLMAKAETPGGGNHNVKGSFISSDEFLRTFRVEQSDVSLTKSLGTGRLWMGEYQSNKVIIKRVEAEVTESFVTKALMNQARTLATLSHPNIVSLVGVTWLAGTDFAVLAEFLAKGNLKSVLSNLDIDLDLTAKLQICLDVAHGLTYLHDRERNMCMKTLSSRKVLVSSTMACKLNLFECVSAGVKIDRGISFPYGMGEIAWLAPEVITRSAPMDARKANIFAFGVLVSEILTRAAPYQTLVDELGNTLSDVTLVQRVKDRRPLCPHEQRHEYVRAPPSLREAVEACLSYDTMSRPTAEQLVHAVQRAMEEARTNSI